MNRKVSIVIALIFTLSVIILGYIMLGVIPMFLFAFGFLGGFILWLFFSKNFPFQIIKIPYFFTLAFFVVHKFEERYFDFFPALEKITGVQAPDTNSPSVYILYACACTWLFIPFLIKHNKPIGYYLAWTFFTSMGVTELAHFFFPFFLSKPYGYFPGMASVVLLAPTAWWGISRMLNGKTYRQK